MLFYLAITSAILNIYQYSPWFDSEIMPSYSLIQQNITFTFSSILIIAFI